MAYFRPYTSEEISDGARIRPAGLSANGAAVTSTLRTAGCGPACPVVWQGKLTFPMPISLTANDSEINDNQRVTTIAFTVGGDGW